MTAIAKRVKTASVTVSKMKAYTRIIPTIASSIYASRRNLRYEFQYNLSCLNRYKLSLAARFQKQISSISLIITGKISNPTMVKKTILRFWTGFVDSSSYYEKLSGISTSSASVMVILPIYSMIPSTGIKSNVAIFMIITKRTLLFAGSGMLIIGK